MQKLKENLPLLVSVAIMMFGCITYPAIAYVSAVQPASNEQIEAMHSSLREFVKSKQTHSETSSQDLLTALQLITQKTKPKPEPQPVAQHTRLQPIPDPMIEAINRMERNHQQLLKQIADRDEKMSEQLTKFINASYLPTMPTSGVDRFGNTKEQLEDIAADVNVPILPDPIVKGLAANPGSRALIHPDHGQPVIATTEHGITNYGGGKQISLIRYKGKMYGQTIMHGNSSPVAPTPPPQPEPFRLNLGNN